jgi:hypothetical protein
VKGIDAEGKLYAYHYTAYFDAKDYPIVPGIGARTGETVALRRIDPNTIELTAKKDGKVVRNAKAILSSGGLSYHYTLKGKLNGQSYEIDSVYDKQ